MSSGRLADVYHEADKFKPAVIQRGNKGTHASLTGSTIFSMAKAAKGQPEVHLGDNKGTSEVHPGHTNHTDTLITQNTMSTKYTHNKSIIPRITLMRQHTLCWLPKAIAEQDGWGGGDACRYAGPGFRLEECLAQSRKDAKEAG